MHYFIYNERKKHGTTEFPVAYYKVNCEQSGYNVPFHWHQEWELIRVLKGDFPMYIDGQEYQVRAGDVLLLREGMLHGGNHQKCVYQCFDFDLHGLFLNVLSVKEYLRPFYRNRLHPIVHFKEYQKDIYPIVDELLGAFEKDSAEGVRALTTLACIARLFAVILELVKENANAKIEQKLAAGELKAEDLDPPQKEEPARQPRPQKPKREKKAKPEKGKKEKPQPPTQTEE